MAQLQGRFAGLRENTDLQRFTLYHTATGRELGRGTYGYVNEVSVDGLIGVGKIFHDKFVNDTSLAEISSKFVEVCNTLSNIRHPNIAQFYGLCFSHDYPLPVLITEKLEGDVESLLQSVPDVPMILKLSMLHDIVQGLHYLHSSSPQAPITHGDLTSGNVLYTSSLVAKIGDVFNTRLFHLPRCSGSSNDHAVTTPPEYLPYLPPEAESHHHKSFKFDIYSFGHLALCILTQMFDESRERHYQTVERLLPSDLSLLMAIKDCLNTKPEVRPMASQLLTTLERTKTRIEGNCAPFAKTNAISQVLTARDFAQIEQKLKRSEEAHSRTLEELKCKDRVIQELGSKLKQQDNENEQLEVSGVVGEPSTGSSTDDLKDIELKLFCGYFAKPRKELTTEGYTHDWTAFVKGEESPDGLQLKNIVQKVVFHLHEDYKPNDKRIVENPPYEVSESGYGEFRLRVRIYFINREYAKFNIPLHLYNTCEVSTVLAEAFSFRRPSKKFREALLLAGGKPFKCPLANNRNKRKSEKRVGSSKSGHSVSKKRKVVVKRQKKKKPMISESESSSESEEEHHDISPVSYVSVSSDDMD